MNPYDSYPLDYTGYGPTGMGNAPTAREMRMQAMNRFRTDRLGSAMQYIDPYTVGAAGMTMQALMGAQNSPEASRRAVFQSAGGQAAMDTAMMARRGGFLGHGDPINYAANISQGIAGGGFTSTTSGTMDGRDVHGRGRVSGQGAIAERVSMNFARGMLTDLYGAGTPDPGKLSGFDMEEASGVFNKLASRGIIGNVANVERNADLNTRLAAARKSAVDPTIKAGLSGIKVSGTSAESDIEELNSIIDGTDDKKLKRELSKIRDSTDAVVINDQERQRVSKVVKAVTEGMASLSDIYGDLSAPELQQKLEQVSGMRITNSQQAKQARTMVNELRGAAISGGMDPRAFMDYSAHMQGLRQGDVARAGGFDSRTASQAINVTAVMNSQVLADSARTSKLANQATMAARAQGINVADAPTLDEISADKWQGRMQFLDKYKSVAMTQGGLDNFSGAQREKAEGLLQKFKDTNNISDPREKELARRSISSQLKGEWASLYGGDFAAAEASNAAKNATTAAYADPQSAREMELMAQRTINVNPMVSMLDNMGAGGGIDQARQLRDKLGLSGMTEFARVSGSESSSKVKLAEQRNILSQAGLSEDEQAAFLHRFTDADGQLADEEGFKQMAGFLGRSRKEGGMAAYDQSQMGAELMAGIGADSNRTRLRAGDEEISLSSIATSLFTGASTGLSDPESMALALGAYGEGGIPGAEGKFATGMDFSGGLTEENLGKLSKIHGKDLGLAKKMGYENEAALIAASEKDMNVTYDAVKMLQSGEYAGLNLSGDQFGMTAIDEKFRAELQESGQLDDDAKVLGARLAINQSLGMSEEVARGTAADGSFKSSRFEADKFKGIAGRLWGGAKPHVKMGEGLGNVMKLSGLIKSSGAGGMSSLAELDEDSDLVGRMQSQYDELAKAKEAGDGEMMVEYAGKDGETESGTIDEVMKGLKASIDKLANAGAAAKGAQIIEEMTVNNVKVTGEFINEE